MSVMGLSTVLLAALCGIVFVGGLVVLGIFIVMNRQTGPTESPKSQPGAAQPEQPMQPAASSGKVQPLDAETLAGIQAALERNQMLNAIRLYREATGDELAEARKAVEAIRDQMNR